MPGLPTSTTRRACFSAAAPSARGAVALARAGRPARSERTRSAAAIAAGLAAVALAGCAAERPGRCGEYLETAGTARITSVGPAPAGEYSCDADPTEVLFDFVPGDPAKAQLAATGQPLTVGAGAHPPRAWVEASGLRVGSEHPALRWDARSGACPPVAFELADVDYEAGAGACWVLPASR